MSEMTAARAYADAVSALVAEHDVADVLVRLVDNCAALFPADAVAILVSNRNDQLELLSASSHRAEEFELLPVQHASGPCVDAIAMGEPVVGRTADEIVDRWGTVGTAIVRAGFHAVHAYPMHWHGRAFGGLNVFLRSDSQVSSEAEELGRTLADIATLVVVHSADVPHDQVTARIHEAVTARATVEQAKGVLAYRNNVDMGTAYRLLLDLASDARAGLGETARRVVEDEYTDQLG
jgi:transcriptional regulator with GAF, ATPase, and Fis domain